MKCHRDSIAAVLGLILAVAAMVSVVATDTYAHAAGAEARGYQALFDLSRPVAAPATLAANEAQQ